MDELDNVSEDKRLPYTCEYCGVGAETKNQLEIHIEMRHSMDDKKELKYRIARITALNDSIGEGYSYYRQYTMEDYEGDLGEDISYETTHAHQADEIMKIIEPYINHRIEEVDTNARLSEHNIISDILTNDELGMLSSQTKKRLKERIKQLEKGK